MPHKKDKNNSGDPRPLNFDEDGEKGLHDHADKPFMTPADRRGDNEESQYYEEEEALSPEEVEERKKEGNL